MVGTLCIEDGETLPTVGEVVKYPLIFAQTDDRDDELAAEWSIEAGPLFGGEPQRNRTIDGPYGPEYWSVLLHGPGWASPDPRTGLR